MNGVAGSGPGMVHRVRPRASSWLARSSAGLTPRRNRVTCGPVRSISVTTWPVDVWGFSLGALTATSLAVRHPVKVRRLVLAASHIRPDGYHPEITAPEQDDQRLPTEEEFSTWKADSESVSPDPE